MDVEMKDLVSEYDKGQRCNNIYMLIDVQCLSYQGGRWALQNAAQLISPERAAASAATLTCRFESHSFPPENKFYTPGRAILNRRRLPRPCCSGSRERLQAG
jgi:hypothetical protein